MPKIELVVYGNEAAAGGHICFPEDLLLRELSITRKGKGWVLDKSGLPAGVTFEIKGFGE